MTVKEYLDNLKDAVKKNPELLKATAIYAQDNEGNAHYSVYYAPTPGIMNDDGFKDQLDDGEKPNALCIN